MASTIIPTLRYRDAAQMIDWLCDTFGFESQLVVEDGQGGITHAQLTLGSGMIMLGSERRNGDEFGKYQSTPQSLGGTTQSPYIVVDDPDAVYARAKTAGAKIVMDIKDEDYGGRGFSCLDPEGHLWNIGSYNPWAEENSG